jgi:hypothetical protein
MADLVDRLINHILTPAGDNDLSAFLCEQPGGCLADAAIAAGDNGDFVREMLHLFISFSFEDEINTGGTRQ